jgi:hypothetical protein
VKFGAAALNDAREIGSPTVDRSTPARRAAQALADAEPAREKSGFLQWIRQAF